MNKSTATDVHFYCNSIFDEVFIRSTLKLFLESGLKCSLSIDSISFQDRILLMKTYGKDVPVRNHKKIGQSINCKILITPSTGVTRANAKISSHSILVHILHSLSSLHAIYPANTFDEFDIIFIACSHHLIEYKSIKLLRNLRGKALAVGYTKFDLMLNFEKKIDDKSHKKILIAPSWNDQSFLKSIGSDLINELLDLGYSVTLRPHPLQMHDHKIVNLIYSLKLVSEKVEIQNPFRVASFDMHDYKTLIGDYSGISFEFAYTTKRPIISIDSDLKISNPNWLKHKIIPFEINARSKIGYIEPVSIDAIINRVKKLDELQFSAPIQKLFEHTLYLGKPTVAKNILDEIRDIL